MNASVDQLPVGLAACDCLTPFGDAAATAAALLTGRRALGLSPVLGRDGGDLVPLALTGPMDETLPPRWLPGLRTLAAVIPPAAWGSARFPVIVASSNFGVGSLYAFTRDHNPRHLAHGTPFASVDLLRTEFGWGEHVHVFSHACVTAHLGLAHAARLLHAGLAEQVLVFAFDFVSPFVAGGFHSLKILNGQLPAPYARRETGSIGLGDGAAFAVLTLEPASFRLAAHALHNEMFHFTSNQPDGAGFTACAAAIAAAAAGRRVWIKGHGTGTLEAAPPPRPAGASGSRVTAQARWKPAGSSPRCWPGNFPTPRWLPGKAASATPSAAAGSSNSPSPSRHGADRQGGSQARLAARHPALPTPWRSTRSPPRTSTAPSSPATPSAAPTPRCSSPMTDAACILVGRALCPTFRHAHKLSGIKPDLRNQPGSAAEAVALVAIPLSTHD